MDNSCVMRHFKTNSTRTCNAFDDLCTLRMGAIWVRLCVCVCVSIYNMYVKWWDGGGGADVVDSVCNRVNVHWSFSRQVEYMRTFGYIVRCRRCPMSLSASGSFGVWIRSIFICPFPPQPPPPPLTRTIQIHLRSPGSSVRRQLLSLVEFWVCNGEIVLNRSAKREYSKRITNIGITSRWAYIARIHNHTILPRCRVCAPARNRAHNWIQLRGVFRGEFRQSDIIKMSGIHNIINNLLALLP